MTAHRCQAPRCQETGPHPPTEESYAPNTSSSWTLVIFHRWFLSAKPTGTIRCCLRRMPSQQSKCAARRPSQTPLQTSHAADKGYDYHTASETSKSEGTQPHCQARGRKAVNARASTIGLWNESMAGWQAAYPIRVTLGNTSGITQVGCCNHLRTFRGQVV